MKKSFILTVLLMVVALVPMQAFNVTVNVDDASKLTLYLGSSAQSLTNGDNVLDVTTGDRLYFSANTGFVLKQVNNGTSDEYISSLTSCSVSLDESKHDGAKWVVTTATLDEVRTAVCKVTVDDASKVTLGTSGTYSKLNLENGVNNVKFVPGVESPLAVSAKDSNTSLYSVTKNGTSVAAAYGSYRIDVVDGDEINIVANYPNIDYAVKFNLSEKAGGFITEVLVNNVPVTNYLDDNFSVKAGSKVTIKGNTNDYKLESFKVNGSDIDFYGSYEFMVTAASTVNIVAHKYGNMTAHVNIDDASHVTVYKGYSYYGNKADVKTGLNDVEIPESAPILCIAANDGFRLVSVTDGTTKYTDRDGFSEVNVKAVDGMNLTVTTAALVRDKKAVVYVEDADAPSMMRFMRKDYTQQKLATGYNTIEFYDGDSPFNTSVYGITSLNVYKNDELVTPPYAGAQSYSLTLADNDVVKLFFTKTPAKVEANITVDGDAEKLNVTKDRIVSVNNFTSALSCLEGTEVAFSTADGYAINAIDMNGTAVTAETDGSYKVVVNSNSIINVKVAVASGIGSVTTSAQKGADVYTVAGAEKCYSQPNQCTGQGPLHYQRQNRGALITYNGEIFLLYQYFITNDSNNTTVYGAGPVLLLDHSTGQYP